jgi:hypothetical protein
MQLINLPNIEDLNVISTAVEPERLWRYDVNKTKNLEESMSFYLWNAELCREFYHPLHFAEILCRNRINFALKLQFTAKWYENESFRRLISERYKDELDQVLEEEREQHGAKMNSNHIVSALSFGFWGHMATKRFNRTLWKFGIHKTFAGATSKHTREDLFKLIETVRRWRNRIAHHRAIFDKDPKQKFDDTSKLISWCCLDTAAWIFQNTDFYKTFEEGNKVFLKEA